MCSGPENFPTIDENMNDQSIKDFEETMSLWIDRALKDSRSKFKKQSDNEQEAILKEIISLAESCGLYNLVNKLLTKSLPDPGLIKALSFVAVKNNDRKIER